MAAWVPDDLWVTMGAGFLGAVVPFTLIVILPTSKRLLDSNLDRRGTTATTLLVRWGRLHFVRSVLSVVAFGLFLVRLSTL